MASEQVRRRLAAVTAAAIVVIAGGTGPQAAPDAVRGRCTGTADFSSPNGALLARVVTVQGDVGCGESRVEVRDASGVLTAASFGSADHEHGWGVERAAWTPDSEFFVFSMSSSGGHQAMRFPTLFYSRSANAIRSLEDILENVFVSDPEFRILPPDTIEVPGWDVSGQRDTTIRVDLRGAQ